MLTLYFKHHCYFCHQVIDFATKNQIHLELKDIHFDPAIKEELILHGGRRQTPYLVDTNRGIGMYESDDIIKYLKENYVR